MTRTWRMLWSSLSLVLLLVTAGWPLGLLLDPGMRLSETDDSPSGTVSQLKFTPGTLTLNPDGTATMLAGGLGGGDVFGPAGATQGQLMIFDDASGKVAAGYVGGAGVLKASAAGVPSPAVAGVDYVAPAGNAATATALAANGTNCAAGTFPLGVNASGAAETCTALPTTITGTGSQIAASAATGAIVLSIPNNPVLPGTTTGTFSGSLAGNASTATALSGNPGNCAVGQAARGITAGGVGEDCFAVQLPLGYTAENADVNKYNNADLAAGGGFYPTVPAVKGYVDAAVAGIGSVWGNITGTLANQLDLQGALDARELLTNKAADVTLGGAGASNTLYPTQLAVKTYVDNTVIGAGLGDVLSVGDCTSGACLDGTSDGGTFISLYDGNSHAGTVHPTNLTGTRDWLLPDVSGTVCTTGSVCSGYQASLNYTAENIDNKYSNADLAGGGGTYPTTPAVKSYVDTGLATKQATMDSADVVGLFGGGTCSGYLKSDGSCDTPPGGVNDPGGNGIMARTQLNITVARTLTGTNNEIEINEGAGQAGNPTIGIPNNAQLHIAKITNLTTNGVVTTIGADGTLGTSTQALTQAGLTWNVTAATCTGDANGGTLTVNGSNEIVCLADDGGGGGTAFSAVTTGENTTATMTVGAGASIALNGGTVTANRLVTGGVGLVEVDGSNVPSLAESADVVAIFGGGTCTGYLKSDGSCDAGTSSPDAVTAAGAFTTVGRLLTVEAAGRGVVESSTLLTDLALLVGGGQQLSETRIVPRRAQIDTSQIPAVVAGPATASIVYHHTFPGVGTPPITFGAPGGAAAQPNELLTFEIFSVDPVAVSWNSIYAASAGLALPTTTIEDVYNVWMFSWNATLSKWVLIAVTPSTESFTPGSLQISDNDTSGAYSALVVPDGGLTAVGGTATLAALVPNPPSGQTMTNTRITRRVFADTTAATLQPNCATADEVTLTALAEDISFSVPSCTPTDAQYLVISLANALPDTTHAVAWDTGANGYAPTSGIALPTVTIANVVLSLQYRWNAALSKWLLVGSTPTTSALTNPMSAPGDMIIGGVGGAVTRLATLVGSTGILTNDGAGVTAWSSMAATKTLLAISCGDLTDEQTGCSTNVTNMVSAAGTLSANQIILGAGTKTVQELGSLGTSVLVLHGNAGGAPTWGAVSLTADVTGDLPLSSFVQASAESKLLGRGQGAAGGDYQEITVGAGLTMTGTTLSSTGAPGGSAGQVQWNNTTFAGSSALILDADDVLSLAPRMTSVSGSQALTTSDGPIVACTAGAGDVTLTLPAGAATTQRWWIIVKVDAGAGACLVDANGTETINGSTSTVSAATQWSRVDLSLTQSGGTPNWSAVLGKTFIDLANDVGSTILPVANGGTGAATLADHSVLVGNAAATPTQVVATANGQCLMSHPSDYANNDPSFQSCPGASVDVSGTPSAGQIAEWVDANTLQGVASNGTGNVARTTNVSLVTPTLGVATATSVNKVALTAPATSATLTIADGKTLTASNTLTLTGNDGSSIAAGAGGTIAYIGAANSWADGVKQTFNPSGTTAGLNVGSVAGDPGTPANGDLWYDSTANELTAYINGAAVALGAGGAGTVVRSIMIPAGAMEVSGGCAFNPPAALLTNGPRRVTIGCTDNDADSIEFDTVMPDGWDGGTITVELQAFSIGNNSGELFVMDFAGQCVSSGDSVAVHSTTGEQRATITWASATNVEQHATTNPITLQGSCAAGDHVYLRGQVYASTTGSTDMSPMTDLRILGVKLEYTRTTGND